MTREEALQAIKAKMDYYESDKRLRGALETLVPELRESEDERIRKDIVGHYKIMKENALIGNQAGTAEIVKVCNDALAWLEKQKEQKHTLKFKVGDKVHLEGDEINILTITGIEEDRYLTAYGPILFGAEDIWERVEQKPVDEEELSKFCEANFNAGKRVVLDNPEEYGLRKPWEWGEEETKVLDSIIDDYEKAAKSFCGYDGKIGLLRAIRNDEYDLSKQEWSEEDEKIFWGLTAYIPNEELEKLGITRDDILKKLKSLRPQPKAEWSEEDSVNLERVDNYLWILDNYIADDCATPQGKSDKIRGNIQEVLSPWLKSLPERFVLQPKAEWSEEEKERIRQNGRLDVCYNPEKYGLCHKIEWSKEDERNIQNLESVLYYAKHLPDETRTELGNFLQSLPNRLNLQPKTEWSEEDEKLINDVLNSLCCYQNTLSDYQKEIVGEEIRKLKSLRPHLSDEEIKKIRSEEYTKGFNDAAFGGKLKEWGEEDEQNFAWFDKFFRAESVIANGRDIPQDKYLWFKSLRPQPKRDCKDCAMFLNGECTKPHWKPSVGQMEGLTKS